jgi:RNase P/RNase MRP subunit p29
MITHRFHNTKNYTEVFLGKKVKIINSSDLSKLNIEGIIIEETKNMFFIKTMKNNDVKKISKKECIFNIEINEENKIINGREICYNLADRIKKYA